MDAAEEEAKRSSARDEAPAEETEQPKKTNKRLIPDLPPVRPKCLTGLRARAVLVIVGGLLIEFTLGSHYTFSKLNEKTGSPPLSVIYFEVRRFIERGNGLV